MVSRSHGPLRHARQPALQWSHVFSDMVRMITEGKENTPTHAKLLREKCELLLLKARLDGEIVDKVEHIVPAWVQYIPDE